VLAGSWLDTAVGLGSIRWTTLITPESVHPVHALDLLGSRIEDRRHGFLLGQVRCGGEAPCPPGRSPCAKIGPSRTARRGGIPSWACPRLRRSREPRPSPRHAVHVDPARSRDRWAVLLRVPPAAARARRVDRRLSARIPPPALPVAGTGSVERVSPTLCVPRPAARTEPPADALPADMQPQRPQAEGST
jgi:hypothetical protein